MWTKNMPKFFTKIPKDDNEDKFYSNDDFKNNDESLEEEKNTLPLNNNQSDEEGWIDKENVEGQLSVDVYQTKDNLIIKSTIAGVKPEDIDISIDNDMITIRGQRKYDEEVKEEDYFYQECYWGSFSRSIVLPMEVKGDEAEASLKNGVLTIVLPKVKKSKTVAVKVKSE